jgi:nitrogen fixation protein FixH
MSVQWVYLPSAKQVLARPAKAKTEVNFMLTSWKQQEIVESGKMFVGLWILNRATTAARCPDLYRCSHGTLAR